MTNPVKDITSKTDTTRQQTAAATSTIEQELSRKMVFRQLQPVCTKILPLRESVAGLTALLPQLEAALTGVDAVGLRGCMDYILYLLLYGIDSIALTRASEHYILSTTMCNGCVLTSAAILCGSLCHHSLLIARP